MATLMPDFQKAVTPSAADVEIAQAASERLTQLLAAKRKKGSHFQIESANGSAEPISIPDSALALLSSILAEMAKGNAVTLVPVEAELTTQQVADILHVSRPYLIDLLEKGEIPHRLVGTHRRVAFKDLMEYKAMKRKKRLAVLEELSALDQELKLGY